MSIESPNAYAFLLILIVGLNTALSRFLPFIIFSKSVPSYIIFLGKVLPSAIIAMLIVYCFKNTDIINAPFGANEMLGLIVVVILQVSLKIPIVSVFLGTVVYMALTQSALLESLFI